MLQRRIGLGKVGGSSERFAIVGASALAAARLVKNRAPHGSKVFVEIRRTLVPTCPTTRWEEGQVSPAGYWPADAHRGAIRGPSGRQKRGVTSSGVLMRSSLRTTVSTHGEGIGWTLPTHVGGGAELDRLTHVLEEFAGVGAEHRDLAPAPVVMPSVSPRTPPALRRSRPVPPGSFGIRTVRGGHFG